MLLIKELLMAALLEANAVCSGVRQIVSRALQAAEVTEEDVFGMAHERVVEGDTLLATSASRLERVELQVLFGAPDLSAIAAKLSVETALLRAKAKSAVPAHKAGHAELTSPEVQLRAQLKKLGLSEEQKNKVSVMLGVNPRFRSETRAERKRFRQVEVLDESEGSEWPVGKTVPEGTPGEKVVVALTIILSSPLGPSSSDPLEKASTQAGLILTLSSLGISSLARPGQVEGGSLALKNLLILHPQRVEKMILKTTAKRNAGTAESAKPIARDAQFSIGHRYLITRHFANAISSWSFGYVANLLGTEEEPLTAITGARARCFLAVAIAKQVCLDNGAWVYASELLMLDSEPPLDRLEAYNPQNSRFAHTPLSDPQFFESVTQRLKTIEDAKEKKAKVLASARRPVPPKVKAEANPHTG